MKCETTNSILTFLLGVFVMLDVLFAVRAIIGSRELRTMQVQINQTQVALMQIQQLKPLLLDTIAYNQKNPHAELTRMLADIQPKPAAR